MTPNILNPAWKYKNSVETDIRKTIAREKKRLAEEAKRIEADNAEAAKKVTKIKKQSQGD